MLRLVRRHPNWAVWNHWINFPLLTIMIWSGLMIYWANPAYLYWDVLFRFLNLNQRLAFGMAVHFCFMWLFLANGIVYLAFMIGTGEWRTVVPRGRWWQDAFWTTLHEVGLSKYNPPFERYNAAQRLAYTSVILMGIGIIVTGLAIYKPLQLGLLCALLGGYEWARFWHFWLMAGFLGFFAIHVIQVARAGWNNFRGMLTGYELMEEV